MDSFTIFGNQSFHNSGHSNKKTIYAVPKLPCQFKTQSKIISSNSTFLTKYSFKPSKKYQTNTSSTLLLHSKNSINSSHLPFHNTLFTTPPPPPITNTAAVNVKMLVGNHIEKIYEATFHSNYLTFVSTTNL